MDERVRPLIVIVKKWASGRGINDASQGTLSSYSLVLMVIHFLQGKLSFFLVCSYEIIFHKDCLKNLLVDFPILLVTEVEYFYLGYELTYDLLNNDSSRSALECVDKSFHVWPCFRCLSVTICFLLSWYKSSCHSITSASLSSK